VSHPTRIRVKICGITTPAAALAAARAGADAIGLVFYAPSPRAVSVDEAAEIVAALPPFVSSVGLFVNAAPALVEKVLSRVPLDLLQFHGDETPGYCESFGKPWMKAIRVRPDTYIPGLMDDFRHARGILLDAWHEDLYGGSGKTFDWYLLRQPDSQLKKEQGGESGREQPELGDAASRVILAGGLKPDNVAQAIRTVMPWGVDVSSGVESAPGIKSEPLINAFMREVQRVF
jgi:phosphoribosylanthranilate isomerase